MYKNAVDAQNYYKGENTTILKRMQWFYNSTGIKQEDKFKANNQICSEFFPKIVKQENSYLLSNGLTVEDDIKKGLGKKFDVTLQKAGLYALVDSVSWGYSYISPKGFAIDIWRGTEVVPLYDERTGVVKAVIRFWQIDEGKPTFVELYEEDGMTEFETQTDKKTNKVSLVGIKAKISYKITKAKDSIGERVLSENNWTTLPICPLYANDIKQSEFTVALKSKIDLYDIINSDFGNNLEDSQDIYWTLKNYQGQDMGEFLADFKYYKTIKVDSDGDATPNTMEVPYEARKTALEMLRNQIYSDAMALDTSVLSGGSITNIAIKSMSQDLELKVDSFENCVFEFVENIINLYLEYANKPEQEFEISFIRRRLVNETETITNIINSVESGIMSMTTGRTRHPYIDDVELEQENIDSEGMSKYKIDDVNLGGV